MSTSRWQRLKNRPKNLHYTFDIHENIGGFPVGHLMEAISPTILSKTKSIFGVKCFSPARVWPRCFDMS